MGVKDKIIILEGVDCCGKTSLGKELARHFYLDFIDNEYLMEQREFSSRDWGLIAGGLNIQQAQFIYSSSGFVKTRYSLTEDVYSKFYHRPSLITPQQMESAGLNKILLLYIDLSYQKYRDLAKQRKEKLTSEREFLSVQGYFSQAFVRSQLNKRMIENSSNFATLVEKGIQAVEQMLNK